MGLAVGDHELSGGNLTGKPVVPVEGRFYEITALGRTQLRAEVSRWRRIAEAVQRVLGPDYAPE